MFSGFFSQAFIYLLAAVLWRLRVPILGLGGAQVALTAAAIATVALLLGQAWQTAVAVGLILAMSSTAIVLQSLKEKGWMNTEAGRAGFSVLLFQDIAVIPILAVLPFLALIVGITLATEYAGLSPALGTFLAGVVLAESEFRHELESSIEPFKGLLLGLFFISVGASIDFALVAAQPALILGLVATLVVIKFFLLLLLGRLFGFRLADSLMFACILAQGGEFAFLLFSFAVQNRVIGSELSNLLVVVVVLSMALTPLLFIAYERLVRPRFSDCVSAPPDEDIETGPNPVIIAGFGRFGQIVSRLLRADGVETTLLDHDSAQIELSGRFGFKVFYGDASHVQLLQAAERRATGEGAAGRFRGDRDPLSRSVPVHPQRGVARSRRRLSRECVSQDTSPGRAGRDPRSPGRRRW